MHEFSTISSLVETILETVERDGASRVIEVDLLIGKLRQFEKDQLEFCYEVVTKGTMMESSKLVIREVDPKVSCPQCGYAGGAKFETGLLYGLATPTLQCPNCSEPVKIVEGNECIIKSVKFQKKQPKENPTFAESI